MSLKLRIEALETRAIQNDPARSRVSDDEKHKVFLRVMQLADDTTHPLHEHAKAFAEVVLASEFDPVAANLALKALVDEVKRKSREAREPGAVLPKIDRIGRGQSSIGTQETLP
jgi:hypothetical protein